jgi:hypothetical protein
MKFLMKTGPEGAYARRDSPGKKTPHPCFYGCGGRDCGSSLAFFYLPITTVFVTEPLRDVTRKSAIPDATEWPADVVPFHAMT